MKNKKNSSYVGFQSCHRCVKSYLNGSNIQWTPPPAKMPAHLKDEYTTQTDHSLCPPRSVHFTNGSNSYSSQTAPLCG